MKLHRGPFRAWATKLRLRWSTVGLLAFVGACLHTPAFGSESLTNRKIHSIGCHAGDGTCFVQLEGAAFGSSLGCTVTSTSEFRFDNAGTADGRRAYASFLAAFLSGRPVSVVLLGCTSQGSPNLIYYYVQ